MSQGDVSYILRGCTKPTQSFHSIAFSMDGYSLCCGITFVAQTKVSSQAACDQGVTALARSRCMVQLIKESMKKNWTRFPAEIAVLGHDYT